MNRVGFTFIEVLACLLILSLGIGSAIALAFYAQVVATRAQAKATGMATALSVALDPLPLMHQSMTSHWQTNGGVTAGWINGYYVVRTELGGSTQPASTYTSMPVSVDVYDGSHGLVASYTTRQLRQGPVP